ncbi:MAG: metallophosphoesterase [Deltaproteobacteria bacterium]
MSASALLLGAVLTFGASDGTKLSLTVTLTESSTLALDWGGLTVTSTAPARRHYFRDLPTPRLSPLVYHLDARGGRMLEETVKPIPPDGPLLVALYGDSRDGDGPHRRIARTIADVGPDVVVHTGDVIHKAGDAAGWVNHLSATLPMTSASPLVYALGNHELWQYWRIPKEERIDAYAAVMAELPAPEDPLAEKHGAPPGVYHVRVGPALFIALDSNQPIAAGAPQGKFLEEVLENEPAQYRFIALHHGPLSSGRHGGSEAGPYLMDVADRHDVTAILAGHDHLYERIVQRDVTVLVSGGGGAPLYRRWRTVDGSKAFVSTYHWVRMMLGAEDATVEAYGLEGTLLDRAALPAAKEGHDGRAPLGVLIAGLAVLFAGLLFALYRIVFSAR